MIRLEIPGFGPVELQHLVSDFTGTLSVDGRLVEGVRERLLRLSQNLEVHILTADTFGTAERELSGVPCRFHRLAEPHLDRQKEAYVRELGPERVMALGNGLNDRLMLRIARVGVAVMLPEGVAVETLKAADILVRSPLEALDLLLEPRRLKATLRF
ncbi:ATPase P [Thermosulfurimonas marina]|uniref:ATPase P n=1 Tax=Thermosulfurimonas marina TaxID=2047767 RepID=A0A6H1WUD6_9BACT|nr:ATPase P [Thermosulfurimonas marina]QJA06764.1 ATPase P [Thermosulfurimonas marina]